MWKQYLMSPVCLKCGSFLCNESLFCRVCFAAEIESRQYTECRSHISSHIYLLDWRPGESAALSRMVYRMKSDFSVPAWKVYAAEIFNKAEGRICFSDYQGFVPIPGSKPSSVHSLLLARYLAEWSRRPLLDLLYKEHALEQKKRKARDRQTGSGITRKPKTSEHFTRLIFVDDVLTTGESFRQSCKALNCNEDSPVLTLFYRPKTG